MLRKLLRISSKMLRICIITSITRSGSKWVVFRPNRLRKTLSSKNEIKDSKRLLHFLTQSSKTLTIKTSRFNFNIKKRYLEMIHKLRSY